MKTAYVFPYGIIELRYEENCLTGLFLSSNQRTITEEELQGRNNFTDSVMHQILEYLDGSRQSFDIAYKAEGTEFQKQVWKALAEIPYGETRTYKQIAEAVGNPKVSRAVGMANNKNPLLLLIPCHRVIGADGSLTGYAGGLEMKKMLLELEKKHCQNQ